MKNTTVTTLQLSPFVSFKIAQYSNHAIHIYLLLQQQHNKPTGYSGNHCASAYLEPSAPIYKSLCHYIAVRSWLCCEATNRTNSQTQRHGEKLFSKFYGEFMYGSVCLSVCTLHIAQSLRKRLKQQQKNASIYSLTHTEIRCCTARTAFQRMTISTRSEIMQRFYTLQPAVRWRLAFMEKRLRLTPARSGRRWPHKPAHYTIQTVDIHLVHEKGCVLFLCCIVNRFPVGS